MAILKSTLNVWAVVVAAGAGRRYGSEFKQFASFAGHPLVISSLKAFNQANSIAGVVLVVPQQKIAYANDLAVHYKLAKVKKVVAGGASRQDSVYYGFLALPATVDLVVVHDGVRPNITVSLVDALVASFSPQAEGLITAVPVFDTLKLVKKGRIQKTIDRQDVWQAQTPQIFKYAILKKALENAAQNRVTGTDEAQLVEAIGGRVEVFLGSRFNIKVTTKEDLQLAECLRVAEDMVS